MELPPTPSQRLDDKRPLVTGAGRGIGLACAAALAQAGAHVCSQREPQPKSMRPPRPSDVMAEVPKSIALDITDLDTATKCIGGFEPFHVLVNNAGTDRPMSFLDVTVEDFDYLVDLNLRAAFFITQTVVRRMVQHGIQGSVINISSDMGLVGGPNRTVYCATKHGMEGMTKAMAVDLGEHGIRINTIRPTFIETPLARSFLAKEEVRSWVLGRIKLGRIGKVEDLMGAVVFLASDASSLMTGSAMVIDGGWAAD